MRTTVLLLSIVCAVTASQPQQRIVGGGVTTISRHPYAAALLYSRTGSGSFSQACGGTIINNRSILTAARCVYRDRANQWRIRVGSTYANSGGIVHNTNSLIVHPSFNQYTLDSDVALVRSQTQIRYTANVARAIIAHANYLLYDNQVVWTIGWGRTSTNGPSSEQLREVQLWTINHNTCYQRYRDINEYVTPNMFCAGVLDVGGRDHCDGDTGGPIIHSNVVVGVASWGSNICGSPRLPGVNTLVSRYSNWLVSNS